MTDDNKNNIRLNIAPHPLNFRYPWRPEQQRILEQLDGYLSDRRIHIVAAPGAGKTVIGLEIFKRLQLRALAIAPTTVVRDQWLERIRAFLPPDSPLPTWCGKALEIQHDFTATTYQSLFSFDQKLSAAPEDDVEAQYASLQHWIREQDIRLLILDEAHHLKAAWWEVLIKLVNNNHKLITLSLTATPPYDASPQEWARYQQLCGPVDEEISIPELVRSNSLCPHQDYIWMVQTENSNVSAIHRQQHNLANFIASLSQQPELLYLLQLHHWLDEQTAPTTKDMLINLDECMALLSLLKHQQQPLPAHLLDALEISPERIPPLSTFGWERLLQSLLDGRHFPLAPPVQAFQKTLASLLKSKRYLKYKRVSLDNTRKHLETFSKTQERIRACLEIAEVEYNARQDWMRLVVLTDFIRDEKFQLALDGLEAPAGAYPIFHHFIHHLENGLAERTALFTGRLSIIHQDLLEPLADLLPVSLVLNPLAYSENRQYAVLNLDSHQLSPAFTRLHREGKLLILIGTRSLLGEGWDAPHVNSLILATQTGAYVTTNQLRGRAIRIDPDDELKTASIWHIIATAPEQHYQRLILQDLHQRFKTFAGIHANEARIESGIERLQLSEKENGNNQPGDAISHANQVMIQRLQDDIYNLQARWQNALEKVEKHVFRSGLQLRLREQNGRDNLSRYVARIAAPSLGERLGRLFRGIRLPLGIGGGVGFGALVMDASLPVAATVFGMSSLLSGIVYWRSTRPTTPLYYPLRFAECILLSLQQCGYLPAGGAKDKPLQVTEVEKGYFRFSFSGFSRQENDLFLETLSQLMEPIQQPRYIIALKKHPQAADIFPVPHRLGRKKSDAMDFLKIWKECLPEFGHTHLLPTSSEPGQSLLLKARMQTWTEPQDDDHNIRLIERWE